MNDGLTNINNQIGHVVDDVASKRGILLFQRNVVFGDQHREEVAEVSIHDRIAAIFFSLLAWVQTKSNKQ